MKATLKIPVTASDKGEAEWKRRAATAVNQGLGAVGDLATRTTALETFQGTATPEIADLEGRTAALEGFQANPSGHFTFTPMALPGSPVDGLTVLDIADGKVKTFMTGVWNAHY